MPRKAGTAKLGCVRSLRLPLPVDRWFEATLCDRRTITSSQLLLELVHGGLRLAPGYMRRHHDALLRLVRAGALDAAQAYLDALRDTFGDQYVAHVESWASQAREPTPIP